MRSRQFLAMLAGALAVLPVMALQPPRDVRRHELGECDVRDDAVSHGSRDSRMVALTFDACPTHHVPSFTPEIVAYLATRDIPATFFISGRWAETYPDALHSLTTVPFFEIGLHGHRHHHLTGAPVAGMRGEIEDGRRALEKLGVTPQPLFRPPFGDHPPQLAAATRRAGVTPVLWDVAPGDPDPKETSVNIERDVLRRVRGGSIVVFHVNGRGVGTAAALPRLITRLRARGFEFVTVGQLIRQCHLNPTTSDDRSMP